jgi:redox-sensing transcriptional repressor
MASVSEKVIHRVILYKKLLKNLQEEKVRNIFSHKLAVLAGRTPAQVRRDLMIIGYNGSTVSGYNVDELLKSIELYLSKPEGQNVALVGLGNLGRAILDYCYGRNSKITIVASFDNDPAKINRIIHGCRCYHIDELEKVIIDLKVEVAIITVPTEFAQSIAVRLVNSGVRGFLNYSPVRLYLPEDIYIENRDMMMAVEKASYFAKILKG